MGDDKEPIIYQLRVVLDGVSPLIWRRLLVPGDYSIEHWYPQFAVKKESENNKKSEEMALDI